MNQQKAREYIDHMWDSSITPTLMEYIKIPNKSPQFDPDWREHGFMEQAVALIADWCNANAIENMTLDVVRLGRQNTSHFHRYSG